MNKSALLKAVGAFFISIIFMMLFVFFLGVDGRFRWFENVWNEIYLSRTFNSIAIVLLSIGFINFGIVFAVHCLFRKPKLIVCYLIYMVVNTVAVWLMSWLSGNFFEGNFIAGWPSSWSAGTYIALAVALITRASRNNDFDKFEDSEENFYDSDTQYDFPVLYVRFDIDKIKKKYNTSLYGKACYKEVFNIVPEYLLFECYLSMGDSDATLEGRENVCIIGLSCFENLEKLDKIKSVFEASSEFSSVAAFSPLQLLPHEGEEPLVDDGKYTPDRSQLSDIARGGFYFWNAKG